MGQALTALAGAGLVARINPINGKLDIKPRGGITKNIRQFIISHKAEILAELKAANESDVLVISHAEPLRWLAARGIYLEVTGIWLQNISIQANSVFPDDEAVAYISAHAPEILNALVTSKVIEVATHDTIT